MTSPQSLGGEKIVVTVKNKKKLILKLDTPLFSALRDK